MTVKALTFHEIESFRAESKAVKEDYYIHESGAIVRINQFGLDNYKALTPEERSPRKMRIIGIGDWLNRANRADIEKYGLTARHEFLLKRSAERDRLRAEKAESERQKAVAALSGSECRKIAETLLNMLECSCLAGAVSEIERLNESDEYCNLYR